MNEFVSEIVEAYFKGYTVKEALELLKREINNEKLCAIIKNYEMKNSKNLRGRCM